MQDLLCLDEVSFSLPPSPAPPAELDDLSWPSVLSPISGHCRSPRKKNHNAYERDRRKKLNSLFSSLRSLLPESGHRKKLSIPSTVNQMLKYIPELQQHIEQLKKKKEELQIEISQGSLQEHLAHRNNDCALPIVSAICLSKKEIMIQLCFTKDNNKAGSRGSFSRVLMALEEEGLQLMNASSFVANDRRIFHFLHLEVINNIIN
ncbi:Transcription factor ORG2 [Apostasia shenzhenica]|uniref:Protein IRON-RELATED TRANSCRIPTION FACTOR 2 n=1 Tax=Apostasia shenzhenica TaxID=1088818 RepID=A0A2I0ASU6_9ASPA|nr:Transcription factor ORG2 [Apostasia shenzhenica]